MEVSEAPADQSSAEKPVISSTSSGNENSFCLDGDTNEPVSNIPSSEVEDDDVDLGGDEPAKDFEDSVVDEDELLKDTENDECRKNVNSNIEKIKLASTSEVLNPIQIKNMQISDIGNNKSISTHQFSKIEHQEKSLSESVKPSESSTETKIDSTDTPSDNKCIVAEDENKTDSHSAIKSSLIANTETVASNIIMSDRVETACEINNINYNDVDNTVNNNNDILLDDSKSDGKVSSQTHDTVSNETPHDETPENMAKDVDCSSNEMNLDSVQTEEGKNSEDNDSGTKFLHIDQDNSRPDESFEGMEIGGEDPFAQTSDDVMDTSENPEKDTESSKPQLFCESNESMDVDEVSCSPPNENPSTSQHSINSNEILVEKPSEIVQSNVLSKNVDVTDVSSCCDTPQAADDSSSEKNHKQSENESQVTKKQDDEICIVPDKVVTKQSQLPHNEKSEPETTTADFSIKSKVAKTQNKPKSKSKKNISSDESSTETESDFEVDTKSVTRPKRNAAKKAESQIKVMSAVDEEVEQEFIEQEEVESAGNEAERNGIEETTEKVADLEEIQTCFTCKKVGQCKINILSYGKTNCFCDNNCYMTFRDGPIRNNDTTEIVPPSSVIREIRSADIQPIDRAGFIRKCSQCSSVVKDDDEKTLSWETMDFCSEECLGKYQQELGSHCANCKGNVQPASLGKYCVRFGYEVKQFCCSSCLEEFKKGLKVCSFCQKDISSGAEGFLAPVGDKGTFKDFCTQACMEKYEQMSSNQPPPPQMHTCHVCNNNKIVEVEVFFDSKVNKLCSDICFTAYKFANKLTVDRCDMCRKYFDKDADGEKFNIFYDSIPHNFCCKTCMNVYILAKRKIVPCNWCKVKKYNFDMIKRVQSSGQVLMMCSLNCLTLYQVSVNAVSSRRIKCDMCMSIAQAQYHLTMSDATIRNFCTYPCVMSFQQQYSKSPITLPGSDAPPIPTGAPKRVMQKNESPGGSVPVISSVASLANGQTTHTAPSLSTKLTSGKLNLVTRLQEPPACRNKSIQTRPIMNTKSVSCRPHSTSVHVQTDDDKGRPILVPIPVPIYVPCPMAMYSLPFPVPIPFPLPIPVPMFLPTTRNSFKGIMKEIKRIQEKVPTDPFEAELLMMAEMVAGDKKEVATSSDSEPDNEPASSETRPNSDGGNEFSPEAMETSNTFGDDIMQMALKMATELDEPAVDLETQLTPATILNQTPSENSEGNSGATENATARKNISEEHRGTKRSSARSPQKRSGSSERKKRKSNQALDVAALPPTPVKEEPKPDALMKLKYTFGVNAWKSWVAQKNTEIEKLINTNKKLKPFKTDILQLTTDELNFSLCLFVKEVKKPNGTQYAPDTIYYLCLGIQQYLFENGRIDNIFTDSYFESFTDALDEIARKFTELFNDHHYIVTRVEEEHLWESKQLGAHSPHVLLSTLMFFNTKHFNLTNVEEHMMLSFSHIMKHWKRNPNQSSSAGGKAPGSRNVLLRFYPPQAVLDDPNSKKKKVYEQHENEENPLRCPVKLYEFYLSKCPESVRSRNDVFYLQPERSCVPDSPVWYSTMALSKEPLEKMLNRVKMVKEINIALLMP